MRRPREPSRLPVGGGGDEDEGEAEARWQTAEGEQREDTVAGMGWSQGLRGQARLRGRGGAAGEHKGTPRRARLGSRAAAKGWGADPQGAWTQGLTSVPKAWRAERGLDRG